ncbi:hypothetical protein [Runella sp.]|uniref:hypothetical protein n=1 Tax=Runella sp. TaxID=1960881 RepID=UPI003D0F3FC8
MKAPFIFFLIIFIFLGCKEEVEPREMYEMLNNRSIKVINYSNSGWNKFSIEEGTNKHVAFYTYDRIDLSQCNDCGNPFIAFEVDPSLSEFNYSSSQEFENIHAISGITSSIAGPIAYPIHSGSISGKKINNYSWIITIDLPADSTTHSEPRKKTGVFTLK